MSHSLPRSLAVCQHLLFSLLLLVFVFSPTPISAVERAPEKLAFSEKNLNFFSTHSLDNRVSLFAEKYKNHNGNKAWKKRLISNFGMLGVLGSLFFAGKMMRSFFKKGRGGKNDNSSRRTIIGLILFAVTFSVIVGLLLAGATGEGGFIWLLVIPALVVVWLIYLASGKSRKSVTAPASN